MKVKRGFVLFIFIFFLISFGTIFLYSYFQKDLEEEATLKLEVSNLFGKLDSSLSPTGVWGSINNPYLIYEERHLKNLYILQNTKDLTLINSSTYFRICTVYNKPCFVGGVDDLTVINSIGSEDFPFISKISGVVSDEDLITLPSGELSNTSTIGNILVIGYESQFDIGLFGNVSDGAIISNLVLNNIQIYFSKSSLEKENHLNYYNLLYHETNHVGILIGHAENCLIENISVYYTLDSNSKAVVDAFVFEDLDNSKNYTTSGGIIGFYLDIKTNEFDLPTSSNTLKNDSGGNVSGLGLGIIYTSDIWDYIDTDDEQDSYILQDSLDIYINESKKYFQVGVFTFVHSTQTKSSDIITKLWVEENESSWTISTNYTKTYINYTEEYLVETKKYTLTKLLKTDFSNNRLTTSESNNSNSGFGLNNYRFMIVATVDDNSYALVKVGSSAMAIKVDLDNFVIPTKDLNYYTFRVSNSREGSLLYPPYEQYASFKYGNNVSLRLNSTNEQYFIYGENKLLNETTYGESERPLRIYYSQSNATISFIAAANRNNSNIYEGIRVNTNSDNDLFGLQRTSNNQTSNWYIGFNENSGFIATSTNSTSVVSIYAVRITTDTYLNDHNGVNETPVNSNLYKEVYIPVDGITFDMSKMVLKYTGNPSSSNPLNKYSYNLVSLESLNWGDNNLELITEVNSVIRMGDPSVYYFISDVLRGVVTNIDPPNKGNEKITVPEASIGFTLTGTNISNTTSKICVIVATNPVELVNQVITLSYFPKNSSGVINGDRITLDSFTLPPVPEYDNSTPILINYENTNYQSYTNFNKVLVCYEFDVPSTSTNTFFLEASFGSLNIVYLSVERTASIDNNKDHINDCEFVSLSNIDYITCTNNYLDTVSRPTYIKSLIVPYFGLTLKEVSLNAYNFRFNICRVYVDEFYYLYINVFLYDYFEVITKEETKQIMNKANFNYTSNSYLDRENLIYVNCDIVCLYLNNYLVDFLYIQAN